MPLYIVLPLVAAVVALIWWQGTLGYDFVSPPPEQKLAQARAEAARDFSGNAPADAPRRPAVNGQAEPVEPAPDTPQEPEIDLGNLETSPGLQSYAVETPKGSDHLVKLATALEAKGAFQRALLAWERVIDHAQPQPDPDSIAQALASVKRLRPTLPAWNIDPEDSIPIVIHAGTGQATATALKPILDDVAREIAVASKGILTVTVDIAVGKKMPNPTGPAPVALWISGAAKDAPATEALSFTVENPAHLRSQVFATVYGLVGGQLKRKTAYAPLSELPSGEDPVESLNCRITRLCWRELGAGLNLAPPPPPAPATPERRNEEPAPRPNRGNSTPNKPAKPATTPAKPAPRATPAPNPAPRSTRPTR
ncbi:hypothetical protein KBB96_11830 [Luteolibacter ambystomatis]|uniref:Uncharacterized protein n=1 Tax=Luteolibacter ambystomatis TaxID=2824561 RepID=A0A975G5Y0_9BACT|nr:hypothetical protein [Luteolibacter ambystomatis]QUE49563.1 hypothetical protein KBB96_11830 [Luteolibacter ambystomatis]